MILGWVLAPSSQSSLLQLNPAKEQQGKYSRIRAKHEPANSSQIPPPSMYNNPDHQHRVQVIRKTYSHSAPYSNSLTSLSVIMCKTIYNIDGTRYSVQCTVYSVQCTVYSVQCTVYSVQFWNMSTRVVTR